MQALFDLVNNIKALDEKQVFSDYFNSRPEAKLFVLDLNRWNQLYQRGVDSKGKSLGMYAPYTLEHKKDPMLDHVTLHEEGNFYRTFEVTVHYGTLEIEANTDKPFGDLADMYGEDIVGLTPESCAELSEFMLEGLIEDIEEKILA